jgi:hypothetical protein
MPAAMLAAARGIGGGDDLARAVGHLQRRVLIERRQPGAIRLDEGESWKLKRRSESDGSRRLSRR